MFLYIWISYTKTGKLFIKNENCYFIVEKKVNYINKIYIRVRLIYTYYCSFML